MEDKQQPDLPRPEPSLPTPEPSRDALELPKPAEAAPPASAESKDAAFAEPGQASISERDEEPRPDAPAADEAQPPDTTPGQVPEPPQAEIVDLPSEFGEDDPVPEEDGAEEEDTAPTEQEPPATEPAVVEPAPPIAAPHGGEPPAPPKKPPPWGWIIGIGCGCGCLMILLAILIPALLGYLAVKEQSSAQSSEAPTAIEAEQSEVQESEPLPDDLSEFNISLSGRDGDGEGDPDGAGLRNAVIFARKQKPGWTTRVTSHEDAWTTVHMVAGPSENALTTWMHLSWDEAAGGYELVNEAPLPSDEGGRPGIYTPGEEVAKEAALVNYPGWVAKVDRHSSDWQTAVVWVGPPQSEWVSEIRLRWDADKDCYKVIGDSHIPYGDEEQ
jgi:hypothetical protein